MAYVGTSIVDYLKSTGQASDYNTRASLAKAQGIQNYTGTADQNTQLLSILNKTTTPAPVAPVTPTPTTPTTTTPFSTTQPTYTTKAGDKYDPYTGKPLTTTTPGTTVNNPQQEIANINATANSNQTTNQTNLQNTLGENVEVSDSSKIIKALTDSFIINQTSTSNQKPLVDVLAEKRASLGVDTKETELQGINTELEKLDQEYLNTTDDEEDRQVSMTQIGRRESQVTKQYNRAKADLTIKKNAIVNELTQKYAVIDTYMKYTGLDYENAQNEYQTKFNQAIALTNLIKGVEQDEKSDADKVVDNARANAQVMLNSLQDKNIDYSSLDDATKLDIQNMELSAGLPRGFMEFTLSSVDEPVTSIGSEFTDASGKRQVPIYTKNAATGLVTAKVITIGTAKAESSGGGDTKAQVQADDVATAFYDLKKYKADNKQRGIDMDQYNHYVSELTKEHGAAAVVALDNLLKSNKLILDTGDDAFDDDAVF